MKSPGEGSFTARALWMRWSRWRRDTEHQAAQASHPPWTRSIPVTSEELVGVECPAVLITANRKPGEKTWALRKHKDESL